MEQDFVLTEEHLKKGLTHEDFSAYAGYPVVAYTLADFPSWPEINAGQELSPRQRWVRAQAIYWSLSKTAFAQSNKFIKRFSYVTAAAPLSLVCHFVLPAVISTRPNHHLEAALARGETTTDCFIKTQEEININARFVSLSGKYTGKPEHEVALSQAAFVLQEPPIVGAREFWPRRCSLPAALLDVSKLPKEQPCSLASNLHELRHLRQLRPLKDTLISSFYREADADRFMHAVLQSSGRGHETNTTWRHYRYLTMIQSPPEYWFPPVLDALEAQQAPPDYHNLCHAVIEIRVRLAMEAQGQRQRRYSSEALQTTIAHMMNRRAGFQGHRMPLEKTIFGNEEYFRAWRDLQFQKEPEIPYSLLSRLVQKKVFTVPLSQEIAGKIVAAAEHFNPALTQEPCPVSKIMRPRRLVTSVL